ncbi:MAG: hypothetical protein C0501_28370 [Isosphaera sp.]|nr:hypothetical protein [Isosphaera sp.]
MARRLSIPLAPHEDELLRQLYLTYRIPSDQYKRRQPEAARFLFEWNRRADRDDCWEDIYHYILTKRKQKKWPTLDGNHLPMPDPDWTTLPDDEWDALQESYAAVVLARGLGSDALLYDADLSSELARDFARRSGRSVPSPLLTALVVSKRKKGEWIHLRVEEADDDLGFGDIDEVA